MVLAVTGITARARAADRGHAVLRDRLGPRARRALAPALAYARSAWCPGTFLVGRVGAARANLPAQASIVVAVAAAVAAACVQIDRRRPGWGAPAAMAQHRRPDRGRPR